MTDHISYAMRNEEAVSRFFYFNPPSALRDWTFVAVEGIILVGFILTVIHALRYTRKEGNYSAVYTVIASFSYGLIMDIVSYYTVESFWHGEFTVMLVFNRLPLYIVLLYPTLIYHAFMTIRRYDFRPLVEAISVGFLGGLLYMIFDNFGPHVGWWIWDLDSPSNWPFVGGVPLTSYGWFFLFTGSFSWLCRRYCWDRMVPNIGKGRKILTLAAVPVATVVLGVILFIPYSALAKNVPPWSLMPWDAALGAAALLHVVEYVAAGMVFVLTFRKPHKTRDRWLMVFPLVYLAGFTILFAAKYDRLVALPNPANLAVVIPAIVVSTAIVLVSHPAGARSAIDPPA